LKRPTEKPTHRYVLIAGSNPQEEKLKRKGDGFAVVRLYE